MYKNMECVCFEVQLKDGSPCEEKCGKMLWLPPEFWVLALFEGVRPAHSAGSEVLGAKCFLLEGNFAGAFPVWC